MNAETTEKKQNLILCGLGVSAFFFSIDADTGHARGYGAVQ